MDRRRFLLGSSAAAVAAGTGFLGAADVSLTGTPELAVDLASGGDWTSVTVYRSIYRAQKWQWLPIVQPQEPS